MLRVVPWGVLGTQLQASGTVVQKAAPPGGEAKTVVIVDPAGLPFIQRLGPGGAGGAAGAIYAFLGIREEPGFPAPVREAIQKPTDAKLHTYAQGQPVIHVVGPNFNEPGSAPAGDEAGARAVLARAYENVLREFLSGSEELCGRLRILPVSGGIFAGPFAPVLPRLTFEALDEGFRKLGAEARSELLRRLAGPESASGGLELCIFLEQELEVFLEAQKNHASSSSHGNDARL